MKKLILSVFILLFIGLNFISAQPKDIPGYKDSRWGMTEDQVLKAMKGEAVKLKHRKDFMNLYSTVGINQVSLDSSKFEVYFQFHKDSSDLRQVKLGLTSSTIKRGNQAIYESLKKHLTNEYGKPIATKTKDKGKYIDNGALWIFPSTTIWLEGMLGGSDQIFILISKNKGKTPEQLGF